MRGILADNNVEAHLEALLRIWQGTSWREMWEALSLSVFTFQDLGLERTAADSFLWLACQRQEVALITANRNDDGPDSLESTIRSQNTDRSLPVFTLADADRLLKDRVYATRVAIELLQYFLEIDNVRGVGRLFVPSTEKPA